VNTDASKALPAVTRVMKTVKSGFGKVYASYLVNRLGGLLLPNFFSRWLVDQLTLAPTLAFSNVPGPLEKLAFKGSETICSYCGFIVAGRCGLGVGMMSYSGGLAFTVVSDVAVCKEPARLRDLLEQAIREYIEMGKKASQ
jgi:hypothetical protein